MNNKYVTVSIDLKSNDESEHNYILNEDWLSNCSETLPDIKSYFSKIDAEMKFGWVLCLAGGWAGGNISSTSIL